MRARLPRTIPRRPRQHSIPARDSGIDPYAIPPAPRPLPNAPSRRPRRSQRKTNVRSATGSSRPALSRITRRYESRTSTAASRPIAPTAAGQRAPRARPRRRPRRRPLRRRRGGRGYSRTWRRRRTASTRRSARSAWRSSRLGCRWRGWSACAGFTIGAYRRGSSTTRGDARFISMIATGIDECAHTPVSSRSGEFWSIWSFGERGGWSSFRHPTHRCLSFTVFQIGSFPVSVLFVAWASFEWRRCLGVEGGGG